MKIELYLISAYEEYPNHHMCRGHWNFQWRGRRGRDPNTVKKLKVRKERFGGLVQSQDGKIYKIDHKGYEYMKLVTEGRSLVQIREIIDISKEEIREFRIKLRKLFKKNDPL